MQFLCKACKTAMRETMHFDYDNGKYEVRLDCPNKCKKGSSHVAFTAIPSEVKLQLNSEWRT